MSSHLTQQQLLLIFGGAVVLFGVLLIGAYLFQRSFKRALKPEGEEPSKQRVGTDASFTMATVKGVITQLKDDQKATQDKLLAAERRAEENASKFDLLAREIDFGLVLFDGEGFITFSNPQVRKFLAVDTWSRRRYTEIFHDMHGFIDVISACYETGNEARHKMFEFKGWGEGKGQLEVAVLPARDRVGKMEVVACVFRELKPPREGTE